MAVESIEGFRLIDAGWDTELDRALQHDRSNVKIVSPFIKRRASERLFAQGQPTSLKVITRFNLADFAGGVSDIGALRRLLEAGAQLRGVRNLHAKLYLFGTNRVIVTSANLTEAALLRNHEFGFVAADTAIIKRCQRYFDDLWARAGQNLTAERLDNWEKQLSRHLATGGRPDNASGLGDEGVNLGLEVERPTSESWVGGAGQAFVKFLGEGSNRVPLSFTTLEEIKRAGCHWTVAYPASKRPSGVDDGALIFIGRLTKDPNDIRVFGRAIGMRHVPGRDDATPEDIALRSWKAKWPRYVRVHHAEFVAGSMANGVSLNKLMDSLQSDSFAPTQRNAAKGEGNTDPRRAYRQQAAVELSAEGLSWLNDRLEASFAAYGKVAPAEMADLDWPEIP